MGGAHSSERSNDGDALLPASSKAQEGQHAEKEETSIREGNDSSDDEKESFIGWLTGSDKDSSRRDSREQAAVLPPSEHLGSSSSGWLDGRPSVDTPLPPSSPPSTTHPISKGETGEFH